MADTQLDATLSASEPISGNLSANEGISASLAPDEEVSGMLEVKRTQEIIQAVWGTITGTLSDQTDLQDALDGKADLENGKVPSSQLPSYVDDVLEYASLSAFPATGEAGKIYIALDTNKTYRWSGSTYVEISESLALGETTGTAYEGSKGKANADAIAKAYKTDDSAETDIQDGDYIPFYDDSASAKRNSLWSNIKAKLKAFIEPFYELLIKDTVGWTGKNLLLQPYPLSNNYPVGTNVIFTQNSDYSITANGTTGTSAEYISLSSRLDASDTLKLKKGKYIFSGNPNTDGTTYMAVNTTVNGSIYRIASTENVGHAKEVEFEITDALLVSGKDYASIGLIIGVRGTQTVTNAVFKPMIRWASLADNTYETYHESVDDCKYNRSEANILGAKNRLPHTLNTSGSIVINEVTWTVNADGSITANGTANGGNSIFRLSEYSPNNISGLIISGVSGGSLSTYFEAIFYSNDGSTYANENDLLDGEKVISSSYDSYGYYQGALVVKNGVTVNNVTFRPMLRLPSDPDNTFVPYVLTNKELTDKFDTLGSASTKDVPASGDAGQTEVVLGSDTRLTDARTPTSHTHTISDIMDFPTLATVATSGLYSDLTGTPDIIDNLTSTSDEDALSANQGKVLNDTKYDKALAKVLGAKNLCPYPVGTREVIDVSGNKSSSAGMYLSDYIDVEGITALTMSIASITGSVSIRFSFFNASKTFILRTTRSISPTSPTDETVVTGAKYVRVNFEDAATNYVTKPMLRLASDSDDTYEPYAKPNRALTIDKCDNSVIAPVENGETASQAYSVGAHFIKNGAFCTAKTAIASGATLTLNTNYTAGQIGEGIGGVNNVFRKSYTLTGASSGDYFYVYRIGNLRIIEARITNTSAGDRMLTLDAVDRPSSDIYVPGCAATKTGVLKIYSTGYVDKSTTSSVAEFYYAPYVVGYTSI